MPSSWSCSFFNQWQATLSCPESNNNMPFCWLSQISWQKEEVHNKEFIISFLVLSSKYQTNIHIWSRMCRSLNPILKFLWPSSETLLTISVLLAVTDPCWLCIYYNISSITLPPPSPSIARHDGAYCVVADELSDLVIELADSASAFNNNPGEFVCATTSGPALSDPFLVTCDNHYYERMLIVHRPNAASDEYLCMAEVEVYG